MNAHDSERLAQVITECYASTQGCERLPVRMVVEIPENDPDGADAEIVMICRAHSATYIPRGKVIQDQMLVSDENLKMFEELGI
jgi:hypothetical protein